MIIIIIINITIIHSEARREARREESIEVSLYSRLAQSSRAQCVDRAWIIAGGKLAAPIYTCTLVYTVSNGVRHDVIQ